MNVRERACESKIRHATRSAAYKHLADLATKGKLREGSRAYRCPLCSGFHVGRPPSIETLQELANEILGIQPSAF